MCGLKKDAILLVIDNGSLIKLTWRHTDHIVARDRWCSTKRILHRDQNRNYLRVILVQMVHYRERYEDSPRPIVGKWNRFWLRIGGCLLCTDILQHFQRNNLSNWFKKGKNEFCQPTQFRKTLVLNPSHIWLVQNDEVIEFFDKIIILKTHVFCESDNFLINSK